jgi:hypothetical protein
MVMEVLKQVMKAAQENFDTQKKKKIKGIVEHYLIIVCFCKYLNNMHLKLI